MACDIEGRRYRGLDVLACERVTRGDEQHTEEVKDLTTPASSERLRCSRPDH
jgi:hypothetical protein